MEIHQACNCEHRHDLMLAQEGAFPLTPSSDSLIYIYIRNIIRKEYQYITFYYKSITYRQFNKEVKIACYGIKGKDEGRMEFNPQIGAALRERVVCC